jgi:hypothetical protein
MISRHKNFFDIILRFNNIYKFLRKKPALINHKVTNLHKVLSLVRDYEHTLLHILLRFFGKIFIAGFLECIDNKLLSKNGGRVKPPI